MRVTTLTASRTVKEILTDLTNSEQRVLQEVLDLERERLALTVDHDVPDLIVKSLEHNVT
jgi:hypothetical protein